LDSNRQADADSLPVWIHAAIILLVILVFIGIAATFSAQQHTLNQQQAIAECEHAHLQDKNAFNACLADRHITPTDEVHLTLTALAHQR
jgi:nitrate reductase gamma subunit